MARSIPAHLITLTIAVFLAHVAPATASPFLVADIRPGLQLGAGSDPSNIVPAGRLAYFTAISGLGPASAPRQLWRTDGTEEGTFVLTEFRSAELSDSLDSITAVGERLFFFRDTRELWVTDGTPGSTRMLRTFEQSFNVATAEFRGELYFVPQDTATGYELWHSDGTVEGTAIVRDLVPGWESGVTQRWLHVSGDRLYFAGYDKAAGTQLWATDGTAAGMRLVSGLWPGENYSELDGFVDVGGRTLFRGYFDGTPKLWATQGTADTTVALADVDATSLVSAGDYAVFFPYDPQRGREPWVTDGTPAGTKPIVDFYPGTASSPDCFSDCDGAAVAAGGLVYFRANTPDHGVELVRTDGTADGTRIVRELAPEGASPRLSNLGGGSDRLFFSASISESPPHLWTSDGTEEGTIELSAPLNRFTGSAPVAFRSGVLFSAIDDRGSELWYSDGTIAGTAIVRDIRKPHAGSDPRPVAALGRQLIFSADDGTAGTEMWVSDGTATHTRILKDIAPGADSSVASRLGEGVESLVFDGTLYFRALDAEHGAELWRTDGSEEGTWLVADLTPGPESSYPSRFIAHDGSLYFIAGGNIYRSDGSASGTKPIFRLPWAAGPFEFASLGNYLYFVARGLPGIWRSDGTVSGTEVLPIDEVSSMTGLIAFQNQLVFSGTSGGAEGVWISDGTARGTRLVRNTLTATLPNDSFSHPERFFPAGNYLYFQAAPSTFDELSLWRTDGTTNGTLQIVRREDYFGLNLDDLTRVGSGLAFSAITSSSRGRELSLVTPGNQVATYDNIVPGKDSSSPQSLIAVGDTLLFSADDGVRGRELWTSRRFGQPQFFYEIAPGIMGSDASHPMRAGNYIYFAAVHPDFGNELWAIPVGDVESTGTDCPGDCNRDNSVTVDELTIGVNIALGIAPQLSCLAIDRDASASTSVDEILAAVQGALIGCNAVPR